MDSSGGDPPRARTLILCFDGTSNEFDGDNTNVVKFFSLLKKDDWNVQMCYYQAGIGTFFNPGVVSPFFEWGAKVLDEAVAWYLEAHVMDGYKFLMQNYRVGDKICLFGFSRGAYTARALGGMLFKVGLLPKDNPEQVAFAYKLYKRTDDAGIALSAGFKQTFSQDVKVCFMGVWDTVASVGIISGRTLPFVNSNQAITTFRHALSLDERRAKFRPNYYHRPIEQPNKTRLNFSGNRSPDGPSFETLKTKSSRALKYIRQLHLKDDTSPSSETLGSLGSETEEHSPTDVMEVWFAGCHSDVGGGAVTDNTKHSLAQISLRWMVKEVMNSECGIIFDETELVRWSIPSTATAAPPDSAELDNEDAVQPIHDQLVENPIWWLLEIVPLHYTWQDAHNVWHRNYTFHLGKGREVLDVNPYFHSSVKKRMETAKLKYKPKAKWTAGTETYVE
jgi:uncharacterized protein (DUF2235 family)